MQTPQHQDPTGQPWTLPASFTVRFDMLSDWHVGSGTGRPGSVDRLIARDPDGLPYIPAKTLTGIWRDALEQLVFALDHSRKDGTWAQWVEVLFGSQPALADGPSPEAPRPAVLTISPARLPEALRTRLIGEKPTLLRQALTFVKPGVAIDSRSGQALPEHLRFEEMARTGTMLSADCTLHLSGTSDAHATASALLLASAQLIERLGGKRRRGAGRCTLTVRAGDIHQAVRWLRDHPQPPVPPTMAPPRIPQETLPSAVPEASQGQPAATGIWRSLPLLLRVETPLAVAARTLGNVTESLDYVPGTLLLPHVTRVLQSIGYDCQAAVASGDLQILPATLNIDGTRGLPVPRVLFQHKVNGGFDKQGTVLNRLRETPAITQLKGFRTGYIGTWEDPQSGPHLPRYAKVPQVLLTHNTIEDAVQRPTRNVGGVYSREAIAPSRRDHAVLLRTELRLHPAVAQALEAKHATWWEQLNGSCRLGVSRKDDYGLVQLSVQGPPQPITHTLSRTSSDTQRLTVWLLSDVLLRNHALRPAIASEQLGAELAARLGVTLELARPLAQCFSELIQVHRIESWHSKWGQPRPSLVAMVAGSCAVFNVIAGTLDQEKLREVEITGIGERRGEGYGQVCCNASLLTSQLRDWAVAQQTGNGNVSAYETDAMHQTGRAPLPSLTAEEDAYARRIELAAWREALQRTVLGVAADEGRRETILGLKLVRRGNQPPQSLPPLSQLGSMRTVLQNLQSLNDPHVMAWLQHLEDTPNRRDKWRPTGALEKLKRLLTEEAHVWQAMAPAWQEPPLLTAPRDTEAAAQRATALRTILWAEAIRALIDACLRAHKRASEPPTPASEEDDVHGA